ncbi:MAG: glutamine--tRNA ligase/YqeY domain fusion protein [Candidatus Fimenecus sp.]
MIEKYSTTSNFIHDFIDEDLKNGVYSKVQTRFPPEPNGYLHIGHAKAICINFSTAEKYNGVCNLRMDDTNPQKEDEEYVNSIMEDIKWLGFSWGKMCFASEYFDFIYDCAEILINKGFAYVDDLTADEIRQYRGTLTEGGKNSPYRERNVEENLKIFRAMKNGKYPDGSKVLRAKIDMNSPNINMRDPVIYRIAHITHHRTGDKWCIYPLYDFAHPLSDYKEGVSFSLCSLEFENHRPLYNWFLEKLEFKEPPRQIEFARLNLNYALTSKRKNLKLVEEHIVDGWDDPRMMTISGMRRRGYPAKAIRDFCEKIGVSKAYSLVDPELLESCVRDELNESSKRVMAILNPLKLIIDNYDDEKTEEIECENHPNNEKFGKRLLPFSKILYIERDDFAEIPPKKYKRLYIGNEVRLKSAYYITCVGVDKDINGNITAVHCTYDPESRGGQTSDGRKVRGTIHWVDAKNSEKADIRLYDRLFNVKNPSDETDGNFLNNINPNSLIEIKDCIVEKSLINAKPEENFQFIRNGYFCLDKSSTSEKLVFNRTVELNSSYKPEK